MLDLKAFSKLKKFETVDTTHLWACSKCKKDISVVMTHTHVKVDDYIRCVCIHCALVRIIYPKKV